jgi:hypothetical protein
LAIATIKATLEHVLNDTVYEYTIPLAIRFNDGVNGVINDLGLPWTGARLGCRTEYWF